MFLVVFVSTVPNVSSNMRNCENSHCQQTISAVESHSRALATFQSKNSNITDVFCAEAERF